MKILCAWCGLEMGEKCPTCGGPPVETVGAGPWFSCISSHMWMRGQGGVTDSICSDCREEHFGDGARKMLAAPVVR